MKKKYPFRILGIVLFGAGVIVGMLLFGVAAWADLESAFYGFEEWGGGRLKTLDCPVLMTTSEVGSVSATFDNPNDTKVQYTVFAVFSSRGLFRRPPSRSFPLDAHRSQKEAWDVTSEDIDLGNFIFAQVVNYPIKNVSFRQATCGILVLDWPSLTGKEIFSFAMIIIVLGIVGGLVIWETLGQPLTGKLQDITRAMYTLGVLVLLGLLVSFLGYWIFGILFFAASVLAIGVILGFLISQ